MSQSQMHKAKQGLDKLERLYNKTLRRLDQLKLNVIDQKQLIDFAKEKLKQIGEKNAIHSSGTENSVGNGGTDK